MKKKNIINLIRYHVEGNDLGFRTEAYEIAKDFDDNGDNQLAEYITALLSNANTFVPQMEENNCVFLEKWTHDNGDPLPLPKVIQQDIIGIVNAVSHNAGVNKFLFEGKPGTGKTETAKQLARILERDLYYVNFSSLIDSKLGPDKIVILFDEIDTIALDRTNSNDLREMGRATSTILKGFDNLDDRIVLIATTNLFEYFDKAITRRFDAIINFDRYEKSDLLEISEVLLNLYLEKFKSAGRNIKLFRKIIALMDPLIMPGSLKNIIKTSIAFSNPGEPFDYLRRLYFTICNTSTFDLKVLQEQGFTLREIEILTGVSKSQVGRELKGENNE